MRRSRVFLSLTAVIAAGAIATLSAGPAYADVGDRMEIPGLRASASVVRDVDGVPHIKASNTHDLFFLQGWQHAEDRLFQMDVTRRRASGTLAEVLGSSALPSDVQMRRLGLRRTAERTMSVLSREARDDLRAYADGVNAWIARNELPGQYASVQITEVEPWSAVDSVQRLREAVASARRVVRARLEDLSVQVPLGGVEAAVKEVSARRGQGLSAGRELRGARRRRVVRDHRGGGPGPDRSARELRPTRRRRAPGRSTSATARW